MTTPRSPELKFKRARLQEEETRLATSLSAVRMRLNELVPVSWLPTEILEQIFSICVSWLYGHRHQKPKQRLAWTQVCRVWRHVSLNSARLWRCIDLCDSRLAREFLLRSKSAPISIVSASPMKLYTDDLHDHAERLQSIDVFLFPDDMQELFCSIGPNLLNLSSLTLKIPPVSWNIALDLHFPSLRRLSLDSVAIPWDDCGGLTHLSLRGLEEGLCPTVSQLFAIFENSPRLECLRLEALSLVVPDMMSDRVIELAHLHELIISAKASIISSILARISYPPSARLRLHSCLIRDLTSLFPRGISCWNQSDRETNEDRTLRLARHAIDFLCPTARSWSEDLAETLISITSSARVIVPVLSSIDTVFRLSDITVLELSTGVTLEISRELLRNFLVATSNLETLRVAFNNLMDLLTLLAGPAIVPSIVSSTPSQLLCPRLQNLLFGKTGDIWWHFTDNWLSPLVTCAKERSLYAPLKIIEFLRCHDIHPLQTEKLKEYVQEIRLIPEIFEESESSINAAKSFTYLHQQGIA